MQQTISGEAILQITRVWRQDWPVSHTRPLLAPGPLRKPKPELEVVSSPRFAWILAGHWRRVPVDKTVVVNEQQWVLVDIGYGIRGYTQAQIDLWQREHAALHAGRVAA